MNPLSGGTSQFIRNTIPEFIQIGIDTSVVCLDDPNEEFLTGDNFQITALGPSKTPWQYSNRLYPWLLANLSKFDVVIIHGLWLYHGYAVKKAFDKLSIHKYFKTRFYVMPHGMLDPYFQKNQDRKLKAIRNTLYWKLIESKTINSAAAILFTCQAELLLARETFTPYLPKKELNVGLGIQAPPIYIQQMKNAFYAKCNGLNRNFILFLSRIHSKKGVDLLIDAYESILNLNNDNEENIPQLVIAGPGIDSDFGEQLKSKVTDNNKLSRNIIFPGMLNGDSKWGAFYLCDAFILPSHQENFGIAVAESLACGKPVLISNQVNIFKEIQSENAGIIAQDNLSGTIELLNNWIGLNIEDKNKMGINALNTYRKYFTIQAASNSFKVNIQS